MNHTDWSILALVWILFGWMWVRWIVISPVFQITIMEVKGFKKLAWITRILCLLFWPAASWISTTITLALMRHLRIPIDLDKVKEKK